MQLCQTCFLVVPQTIKVGLTKVGNQAKPLKYSERKKKKSCISYQLADVQTCSYQPHTKPTTTQQTLTCALKHAWQGCCCLKDIGSKNLFRINISLPFTSLDWMRQACGWSPRSLDLTPMDFFLWGYMEALIYTSTVDSEEAVTACSLRQQQPSDSNLALLSAHVNFSCVIVSFVLRLVAAGWSICSKLVRNTTFFQNTSVTLLNIQPRSDPPGLSVELQGHMYNIQLLDNKFLFQSLLSPHKV